MQAVRQDWCMSTLGAWGLSITRGKLVIIVIVQGPSGLSIANPVHPPLCLTHLMYAPIVCDILLSFNNLRIFGEFLVNS